MNNILKEINPNDSDFVKGVKDLINKNIQTYQINDSRITSDYGGEVGTTKSYNGRQLLELLQNADDEETGEVLIELDSIEHTLTVSNNGNPFTVAGIASLMIANNSNKKSRKREIIGNKGLGFRSILNWTDKIEIIKKDITLEFSPTIAKDYFEKIISDKIKRDELIKNEKPPVGHVPFAVLAIPELRDNKNDNWETSIKLHYKDDGNTKETNPDQEQTLVLSTEESILIQLESLKPEILLFLNSIKEIIYSIDGKPTIIENKEKTEGPKSQIVINGSKWNIKDTGDKSLKGYKEKHYRIKVAWKDDLSDSDTYFYTYFPTQVSIHLPCIIHASFDLDPTRNHINNLPENITVLEEVVTVLCELSEKELKTPEKSDWLSYRLLTPTSNSENIFLKTNFFEKLALKKKGLEIYPSVDGNYYSLEKVIYYGEDFSNWVQNNGFGKSFPGLLLPNDKSFNLLSYYFTTKYSNEDFLSIISEVSEKIIDLDERVSLIQLLSESNFNNYHRTHYPLLLDTSNNVISMEIQVFTLTRGSIATYAIPEFTQLSFIQNELFEKMLVRFSENIKTRRLNKDEDRSRTLKRILEPIINIGSADILDVAKNLVSSLNNFIDNYETGDNTNSKEDAIDKTLSSLFKVFREEGSREGILKTPIFVCSESGIILKCNELFLGKGYPSGQITEDIFDGIYSLDEYISKRYVALLDGKDVNSTTIENFLLWLGVNKHVKYKKIDKKYDRDSNDDYIQYVYEKLNVEIPRNTGFKFNGIAIDNIENTIARLSFEKLILLIIKEFNIKQRLDFSHLEDSLEYSYNVWTDIYPKPSYIYFQLSKFFNFEDFIIDNNNLDFINKVSINTEDTLFIKNNISEEQINQVLLLLGAKNSISQLRPKRIYEILKNYETLDNDGKTTQAFYRLALNNLEKRDYNPTEEQKKNLHVFAKTGDGKNATWLPTNQVFYSNNTALPSSILKGKYILAAPKSLKDETVKKYLGVSLFSDLKLEFIENTIIIDEKLTTELNEDLDTLRPYFLAYRLSEISEGRHQRDTVKQLKNYRVFLITEGKYKTKEDPEIILNKNEFIRKENEYFVCIKKNSSLSTLKNDNQFCNAIVEILCLTCKVWEHRDQFRMVFKYGAVELESQFEILGDEHSLIKAKQLLGISPIQVSFWKAIYKSQGIPFISKVYSEEQLKERLSSDLGLKFNIDYSKVGFENFENHESVNFLKIVCNDLPKPITLIAIKNNLPVFHGLKQWHGKRIIEEGEKLQPKFDYALWVSLFNKDRNSQKRFLSEMDRYSQFIGNRNWLEIDAYNFDCNYSQILINALTKEFNISFEIEFPKDLSIKNVYPDLFKNGEDGLAEMPKSERSLSYFIGHEDLIKKILVEINPKVESPVENTSIDISSIKVTSGTIVEISAPTILEPTDETTVTTGVYTGPGDRAKKIAGKKAETKVVDYLRKTYQRENVTWISGYSDEARKNDRAGYDVRYKINKDSDFIYVEVKSYSENSFIISPNEVKKGFEKKEKYQIALVNGDSIYFVNDYFIDKKKKKDFEILNSISAIKPLDFVIYFKLPDDINII